MIGRSITDRQLELVAMYASGLDYSEIAALKYISYHTAKNTLKLAMAHTGSKSLAHLCAQAVHEGLLTIEPDGSVSVSTGSS